MTTSVFFLLLSIYLSGIIDLIYDQIGEYE